MIEGERLVRIDRFTMGQWTGQRNGEIAKRGQKSEGPESRLNECKEKIGMAVNWELNGSGRCQRD